MAFGNMLKSFLHPERGYEKAQAAMDPYYAEAQGYMRPYVQQGQAAYGPLSGAMQRMLDPVALQNEWASGYEMSPYAAQLQDMAQTQGMDAANSMGIGQSTPALRAIQSGTSMIGAQDRERYLDSLWQKYMTGAQLAQNLYGQGANAANTMGNNAMNMGNFSSQMAFGGQNAPGELFGNLVGTAAGLGGSFMNMRGMNNLAKAWTTGGA